MNPPAFDRLHDARVRGATIDRLSTQVDRFGDVLPREVLAQGFELDGKRVPLLGPQGIFKPAVLDVAPLSLTTTPRGPYDDVFGPDELLHYRYRGEDPTHRDNRGVRFAMQEKLPLIYFHGLVPGRYLATWPVFVEGDRPEKLTFTIEVDDAEHVGLDRGEVTIPIEVHEDSDAPRRRYITAQVRHRMHQRAFRERVLRAYRHACAFCRFRHEELLDAAHITPDSDATGEPRIENGLALCRLHHAAFDRHFLGVRPDYVVQVRPDLLDEEDGPTLVHGIQSLHDKRIIIPKHSGHRPDRDRLARRFTEFQAAADRAS